MRVTGNAIFAGSMRLRLLLLRFVQDMVAAAILVLVREAKTAVDPLTWWTARSQHIVALMPT